MINARKVAGCSPPHALKPRPANSQAQTSRHDKVTVIDGKSIERWNSEWQPIESGFILVQSKYSHTIGLFAAKLNERFVYIGSATKYSNGGLRAALSRARRPSSTDNTHFGLSMLREHIDEVECYVLLVGGKKTDVVTVEQLKMAMIEAHCPRWNAPVSVVTERRRTAYKRAA